MWQLPPLEGNNVYRELLSKPAPMFQGMLVSKVALEKINYLDEKVPSYQEWDTSIRLAKYCDFIHIKEPLFIYYLYNRGTISKEEKRDVLGYKYIVEKHKDDIIGLCGEQIYNKHKINNAKKAINWGLYKEAKSELKKVTTNSWFIIFLQFCTYFHVKPHYPLAIINKIKKWIYD